jgi:soluble lytic murein transglycosylase-like protein
MNRILNAILVGVLSGSLAVIYLGMVIANPKMPENVKAIQDSLVSEMLKNSQSPAASTVGTQNKTPSAAAKAIPADCALRSNYSDAIRQWCGTIQTYASQHKIDPNLVAAVMQQESGGDSSAYSSSGAVGLLQVMPSDGIAASFYCASGPCFSGRPSTQELLNPDFNISYGVKMLSGLVERYQNVREALRAYGPVDVGYTYADTVLAIYGAN